MAAVSALMTEELDEATGAVVVRLGGTLDHSTAPALCSAIERAASTDAPAGMIVDLSRVEACDPRCVVVLISAAREAGVRLGRVVCLVTGESPIARQLARSGAPEFLRVVSDPPAAG